MSRRTGAPRPAAVRGDDVRDPAPQVVLAVQNVARDWAVLWSRWRRTFTAIARFGAEPLIVDDADPVRLLERCRAAEIEAAYGRRPPAPEAPFRCRPDGTPPGSRARGPVAYAAAERADAGPGRTRRSRKDEA